MTHERAVQLADLYTQHRCVPVESITDQLLANSAVAEDAFALALRWPLDLGTAIDWARELKRSGLDADHFYTQKWNQLDALQQALWKRARAPRRGSR